VGEIGISVAAPYREEGIGTECMKALIGTAKQIGLKLLFLHCFENNPRAHHTYEKVGFVRAGSVPGMYSYKGDYLGEVTYYLNIS
jgi:RimJ/RimL family protein N-acetyltransferase